MALRQHALLSGHRYSTNEYVGGVVSVEGDIGHTLSSIILANGAYLALLPNPLHSICIIIRVDSFELSRSVSWTLVSFTVREFGEYTQVLSCNFLVGIATTGSPQ